MPGSTCSTATGARCSRAPTTQNAYLEKHSWDEYAAWHLGLTEGANDETKARYAFVYGDFRRVHRSGLIACVYRASEWRHKSGGARRPRPAADRLKTPKIRSKGGVMKLPTIATRAESVWRGAHGLARRREGDDRRNTTRSTPLVATCRWSRSRRTTRSRARRPRHLVDLFEGRRQLIIYHFMFDPSGTTAARAARPAPKRCRTGLLDHLHTRDTSYAMVSRAPLEKLERWKAKQGWDIPWYSSYGTDFNYDFGVTIDESRGSARTTSGRKDEFEAMGDTFFDTEQPFEMPGPELLPARRRACVPHLLAVRAWAGEHRWLVLLPRPDRPRSPGGVGGTEGPQ